jgi:2-keto-4-pentenoate hydratase
MDESELAGASRDLLAARRERALLPCVTTLHPGCGENEAYRIARLCHDARVAAGERMVGRKIGFTNRNIWKEYQVFQPIWGYMYASTVANLVGQTATVSQAGFCQPRIEPEIIVRFARAPDAAEPEAIAASLEWVAHGFEVVDTHYLDWKFRVADTIADFGLHGALFVGQPLPAAGHARWAERLSSLNIELHCNGEIVDRGRGSNVLDGPLQAIAHLMKVLAAQDQVPAIAAGEIVTTGTLTAAWPIAAGQTWHTRLEGVDLPGANLTIR